MKQLKGDLMKNIVFIVDGYYPNFSAVGVCIYNLVQELSEKFNITIITKKSENSQKNIYYENSRIRYINTTDNYSRNKISERLKTSQGVRRRFLQMEKISLRAYGYMGALIKKSNVKQKDIEAYLHELEKLNGEIDTIIPTCLPFESVLAALEYKKKYNNKVKVVPFLFDKFSQNKTLHRTENNRKKKFKNHLLLEKRMLEECNKVLFVDSWNKHLETYFPQFDTKFFQVEHPLLKRITTMESKIFDPNRINIVYTGSLYKKLRSPLTALKLFTRIIEKDKRILLHFYINGDCSSIVNSYCELYPENIINHGSVPTGFAKAAIINADILLSIGNSDISQLPSKIFEYVSTGNPIVHFYSNLEDPVISILKQYNNSCCVSNAENLIEKNELNILELIKSSNNRIEFEEVENIYYKATPKYIANKIIELF
ncbi:hypothetical protein D1953_12800 [Peribacillus asahii]|uniref:Glycosyltransferase n=1 Tax=Peribacillus asahii TaxID=228899 RepID=A0A398B7F0_9BACI|nr:hypothetical protein [Peribacillus asahii]RID84738.1 hypothetical protein D1953_12800 [Peribacillus asahii]